MKCRGSAYRKPDTTGKVLEHLAGHYLEPGPKGRKTKPRPTMAIERASQEKFRFSPS